MMNKSLIIFYTKLDEVKQAASTAEAIGGNLKVPDDDLMDALRKVQEAIEKHESDFEIYANEVGAI